MTNMDVKSLINAILARYSQRSVFPPMKTKLVKLIYLTELEYFRRTGQRLTSLDWQFYYFGPYAKALESYLGDPNAMQSDALLAEIWAKTDRQAVPRDQDLEHAIADVVHSWGEANLNDLLDYVYFETEPMQSAHRGDYLDFSTVQRVKAPSLSLQLDKKKLRQLREQLQQRSAAYAEIRRPSVGPEDLFANLKEWDTERSPKLVSGECSIDPQKLKSDE